MPALLAGMAQQRREVLAIANKRRRRTSPTHWSRSNARASCSSARNWRSPRSTAPTPTTRCRRSTPDCAEVRRSTSDFIFLNAKLFGRVKYAARPPGQPQSPPRAGQAARCLLQAIRARRRRAGGGQADPAQGDEHAAEHAPDRLHPEAARGRQGRCVARDGCVRARRPVDGEDCRRAASRQGPQGGGLCRARCKTRPSSRRSNR